MDSFGKLGSQKAIETDDRARSDDPSYIRSSSFTEVPVNLKLSPRVTWTPNEKFYEGHLKFQFYEENGRILSNSEQGRHIKGVFLDKVCADRDCASKFLVTKEFYPVLKRLLDARTNWSSEFAFRGLDDFTFYVMEWTDQVLINHEHTLRQADIYGLVAISQYPYSYHKETWGAFCELWGPLTHTLHHGGGEMGISLNDLKQVGSFPILGVPYEEYLPFNERLSDRSQFPETVLELLQIHTDLCRLDNKKEVSW